MILITGGSGYLAGRIIESLLNNNFSLRISLSRKSDSLLADFKKNANNFEIVEYNYENQKNFDNILDGVTHVIHLAALNFSDSNKFPELAYSVNFQNTKRLMHSCIEKNINNFFYVSTVHVYGSPLQGKLTEKSETKPGNVYSETHFLAENELVYLNNKFDFNGTIIRLSNAVGPPINSMANCWDLLVNDICKKAIINEKITIRSNKKIARDFVTITSFCNFINFYINNTNLLDENIYNFSSNKNLQIIEICDLVTDILKSKFKKNVKINYLDNLNNDEIIDFKIDNRRLTELNCNIDFSIQEEIEKLLFKCSKWFL